MTTRSTNRRSTGPRTTPIVEIHDLSEGEQMLAELHKLVDPVGVKIAQLLCDLDDALNEMGGAVITVTITNESDGWGVGMEIGHDGVPLSAEGETLQ